MEAQTNYDAYLTKRARSRKIGMLVASVVSFLLAACIIVLSCVNVNNRPKFIKNPNSITITTTEVMSGSIYLYEGTESYNNFIKVYNNVFTMDILSSLFSGNFGSYSINELPDEANKSIKQFNLSDIKNSLGNNYVQFSYNGEEQDIRNNNGSLYNCTVGLKEDYKKLTFNTIYFPLSENNTVKDLVFYVPVLGNMTNSSSGAERRSLMTITIKANTSPLFKSLSEFKSN